MIGSALRIGFGTASLLAGGWALRALQGAPSALGASPVEIDGTAKRSPNYKDGAFVNLEPASAASLTRQEQFLLVREVIGGSSRQQPSGPVPLVTPDPSLAAGDLAVTWYGHSSAVIEIDGYRVLADPVWSDRCSPSKTLGPRRLHPVPAPLEAMPAIDAVIISHDHYDHLDIDTVQQLARTQRAKFFVPLGIGAHLRNWHIPADRIVELDWNESARLGDLTLVCTPARHFSGRFLTRNTTLWSSWALIGPSHRAFFGGDTGYSKSFADIGAEYGPFDLCLMPVGAYHPGWPDIHMNPEDAVRAHRDVTDAGLLVPIHWATFRLAPHPWSEPVERLVQAAEADKVLLAIPKPGQRVQPDEALASDPWWLL
jgi:L-ascorbate metabolism protein UlaG (beta-lactamase superfamily)